MAFASIGDVEMFYTDDGEGPPVLLVHGWSCDSHDWNYQYDAFTARHRVIAADNRGHGRSTVTREGYEPRVFAADLAALIDELGVGPVVAVGHSLGGVIVSALAVEHPALVRALVAVDPAYAISASIREAILANAAGFRAPGGHDLASRAHRDMDGAETPDHLVTWHGRRVLATPPEVVAETYAGIYEPDDQIGLDPQSSEYLLRRECPVLAIYALPKRAAHEESLSRHPYSRSLAWPGAGHWLHQERPGEFNELVLDWIAGLGDS
jgi:pimeloyl-ACP methyl ester carboxylesterase